MDNWPKALDWNKAGQMNRGQTIAYSEDTALAQIGTKFITNGARTDALVGKVRLL